jgi:hypothetical protein
MCEPGLEPKQTWDCDGLDCENYADAYVTEGMPSGWYWLAIGQATRGSGRDTVTEHFCSWACLNKRIRSMTIGPDEESQ